MVSPPEASNDFLFTVIEPLWAAGLLFAAALLPQYLIYVPAFLGMFTVICSMSGQVKWRTAFFGRKAVQYCLWCVLFLTIVLWGILLEAYVNPLLLQWLLKS